MPWKDPVMERVSKNMSSKERTFPSFMCIEDLLDYNLVIIKGMCYRNN